MAFAEDKGPARARGWPAGRGAATEQGVQDKRSPAQTARARAGRGVGQGLAPALRELALTGRPGAVGCVCL